jgi:hypothetical protein
MINQENLPGYIGKEIPELSGICEQENCRNVYDIVKQMLRYTTAQVLTHNISAAKQCLCLAEKLYKKGNAVVKNAIENVFVYSFSHAFFHDSRKRKEVMDIVPASLYELYKKQVINSHL